MTLANVDYRLLISEYGRLIQPQPLDLEYTEAFVTVQEYTITAGVSAQVIQVGDKGVIKQIELYAPDNDTSLTCVWNTGDTRAIKDMLILTDNITSLTVSNSDVNNSKTLIVRIISQTA